MRDIRLVARLQQVGISLDVEEQLTHPRSPLRSVLIDSLLSPHAGPSTYILDQREEHEPAIGLAQMHIRPGRPERDVVFVSPALDTGNGSHAIWQRLLSHLAIQTADQGNLRLYAGLSLDSEELHLFKNVGFMPYCQEDIYHLTTAANLVETGAPLKLRPQHSSDGWGLQKLYGTLTPRSVQNAEGLAQGQWALTHRRWGEQGRRYGYVWELSGELLGAIYLRAGKRGYWLRTLLHPDAIDQATNLARAALRLIDRRGQKPVYFACRQYEMGWHTVLTDLGFKPFSGRVLVVKPMTVRIREKTPMLIPSLEKTPSESAATPVMTHVEMVQPPSNGSRRREASLRQAQDRALNGGTPI